MFGTMKTLFAGANARSEERVRDRFSIEIIDQKVRESEAALRSAKLSLAHLVQRARTERGHCEDLKGRIEDLMSRAKQALSAGRKDLASQAAGSIAEMENELVTRERVASDIEARSERLRLSVEKSSRRLKDLKQGALAARSAQREKAIQARLNQTITTQSTAFEEAEEMIAKVLNRRDPLEEAAVLREIEDGIEGVAIKDKLADAGFGAPTKSTSASVMARLLEN